MPYKVDETLQPSIFARILTLDFSFEDFEGSARDIEPTRNTKAIIKTKDKRSLHSLANFYCELATQALENDEFIEVIELLENALKYDANSCRANWLLATIYENHQQLLDQMRILFVLNLFRKSDLKIDKLKILLYLL